MSRRRLSLALMILLVGALGLTGPGCAPRSAPSLPSPTPSTISTTPPTPTSSPTPGRSPTPAATSRPTARPSPTPDLVEALLRRMTVEDKVGQLLMAGLPGPSLDEYARHAIVDLRAGGVVLVARNAENPQQLRALLAELQNLARSRRVPVPLFVSINHEGGSIVRVQTGVTIFPSNMAVGAAGSRRLAYEIGRHEAEELAALGINMNLAPVLDVNSEPRNPVIGLRSFGARPDLVSELGVQFIRGTQEVGVIAVAKHFPGHGAVAVDSHYALPVVSTPADELWAVELEPFRRAIEAGVEAIMSAHLVVPALSGPDPLPASLSRAVMTDLLRGRLGFRGLIITDDLDMKGVTGQMSAAEAAVRAVEAGADVVVITYPASQDAAFDALLQAVQSGRLPESRVDESVRRILTLKARHGLFQAPARPLSVVGSPEHLELARRASEAAITSVNAHNLPLLAGRRTMVISPRRLPAGEDGNWTLFGQEIRRRSAACRELLYDPYAPAAQQEVLAQALALAGEFDQVVIGLWDASLQEAELGDDTPFRLVQAVAATGVPVAVVAFQLPYDLARVPEGVGAVATYGETPPQVRAAAAVLFGELEAQGTLPVPLR